MSAEKWSRIARIRVEIEEPSACERLSRVIDNYALSGFRASGRGEATLGTRCSIHKRLTVQASETCGLSTSSLGAAIGLCHALEACRARGAGMSTNESISSGIGAVRTHSVPIEPSVINTLSGLPPGRHRRNQTLVLHVTPVTFFLRGL
jgi:hypothetical protein